VPGSALEQNGSVEGVTVPMLSARVLIQVGHDKPKPEGGGNKGEGLE